MYHECSVVVLLQYQVMSLGQAGSEPHTSKVYAFRGISEIAVAISMQGWGWLKCFDCTIGKGEWTSKQIQKSTK